MANVVQLFAPPTKVQGSFPLATVTVYMAGTTTLATLYADSVLTPKGNPFTAAADGTWDFWGAGGLYDVQFSGAGIPAPFTLYALGVSASTLFGKQYVNVMDFGAKGNGTADDTAAIQAAVNSLGTTGGTVFLPCGTYHITGPIQFWFNDITNRNIPINFEGAGRQCTILYNSTQSDGINPTSYSRISSMTIRGASSTTGSGIGIDSGGSNPSNGPSFVTLENLIIENWPSHCVNSGGWSSYWIVNNVVIRNGGNEAMLITANSNYWQVSNFTAYGCRFNALDVSGVGHQFSNIEIYQCGGTGLSSVDQDGFLITADTSTPTTTDITLNNVRLYQNNTHGLRIQVAPANTTIKRVTINNLVSVGNGVGDGVSPHDAAHNFGDGVILVSNGTNTLLRDITINNMIVDGNTRWGFTMDSELASSLVDRIQVNGITAINHIGYGTSPGSAGVVFAPFLANVIKHIKIQGQAFSNTANLVYNPATVPEDQIELSLWTDDASVGTMTNLPGQSPGWVLSSSGNVELVWHSTQAANRDWKLFQNQFGNFDLFDVVGNQNIWSAQIGTFIFQVSPSVQTSGNSQIELKDTATGVVSDWVWFIDQFGTTGFADVNAAGAKRLMMDNAGNVWVPTSFQLGPNAKTNHYAVNDLVNGGGTLTWTAVPVGQTQDQVLSLNTSTVPDGCPCAVGVNAAFYGGNTLFTCFRLNVNQVAVRLLNQTGAPLTFSAFVRVILWGF